MPMIFDVNTNLNGHIVRLTFNLVYLQILFLSLHVIYFIIINMTLQSMPL